MERGALFYQSKGQIDTWLYFFCGSGNLMFPKMLGTACHNEQAPIVEIKSEGFDLFFLFMLEVKASDLS